MKTSRIPDFNKLSIDERIKHVRDFADLSDEETRLLYSSFGAVSKQHADRLIENCICGVPLMGIVTNAKINDKEYLIPVSIDEPSIIAAASRAFRLARDNGIQAQSLGNYIRGQIQITNLVDMEKAESVLKENEPEILKLANEGHTYTRAEFLEFEQFDRNLLLYLIVDTGDIQGANTINRMCESLAGLVEELTHGEVVAGIVSNYADRCLAKSKMRIRKEDLARPGFSQEQALERFLKISRVGEGGNVPRAATNNKGIMNGIIGAANATGQDTRAIYSAAESYAYRSGKYASLSRWYEQDEYLVGELEMPMPLGIIGGATDYPYYSLGLEILGVSSAQEFQEVLVSLGLANNFAAIQEIATVGITQGHMKLHGRRYDS